MNGNDGFILPGMGQENMQNSMNSDPNLGRMPGMDGQQNPMDPMMGNPMGGDPYQGMNPGPNMAGMPGMDGQQGYGMNQGNPDSDVAFVKNWMGTLYDNAHSKKFNWCAALLGPIYMLYRKIYTTGSILLVLEAILLAIGSIVMKSSVIGGLAIDFAVIIAIAVGLGLGFYGLYRSYVKGRLEAFKKQVSDGNQLVAIASKKGGTSIVGAVIAALVLIIAVVVSSVLVMGESSTKPKLTNTVVQNTVNNLVEEPIENENKFVFTDGYYVTYSSEWFLDEVNKVLTKGDNTLGFTSKITSADCGFQLTTQDGRTALLNALTTQLSAQAAQSQIRMEKGNENFVPKNDNFYNYIDYVTSNSIQRFYFIVLPSEDALFYFTLANTTDTTINTDANMNIIDMLTQIKKDDNVPSAFGNEITTSNIVSENNISSNVVSNEVSNVLSNDTQTGTGTAMANNSVNQQQSSPTQNANNAPAQNR